MKKAKTQSASSLSNSSYLLLAVKILLVLLILFLLPKLVDGRNSRRKRTEQDVRNSRKLCEKEACRHLVPEESLNCVFECMSSSCYEQIYASNPLEDGEIDVSRARDFNSCVKDEKWIERKKRRQERVERIGEQKQERKE